MSVMNDGPTRVTVLTREESLHLLQNQSYVGRVGFVADGQLIILPVNYLARATSSSSARQKGPNSAPSVTALRSRSRLMRTGPSFTAVGASSSTERLRR
jgi:hypothetical protein